MVQTFLTHADFSQSAKNLDFRRLGKQRTEAYQILLILRDLDCLAKHLSLSGLPPSGSFPLPDGPVNKYLWIRQIAAKYRSLRYLIVRRAYIGPDGVSREMTIQVPKTTKRKEVMSLNAQDRLISLGFAFHPAVEMWLGYQGALCEYIDAHIEEWERRGYVNSMAKYGLTGSIHPAWTFNEAIHRNHRAALLNKELDRHEAQWYRNKPEFVAAGPFEDYIWATDGEHYKVALVPREASDAPVSNQQE